MHKEIDTGCSVKSCSFSWKFQVRSSFLTRHPVCLTIVCESVGVTFKITILWLSKEVNDRMIRIVDTLPVTIFFILSSMYVQLLPDKVVFWGVERYWLILVAWITLQEFISETEITIRTLKWLILEVIYQVSTHVTMSKSKEVVNCWCNKHHTIKHFKSNLNWTICWSFSE